MSDRSPEALCELAESLARKAHQGQTRRPGKTPYTAHLEDVVRRLAHEPAAVRAVGWLHDILEDTPLRPSILISAGFSREVADAVTALTKKGGEPYMEYLERVRANPIARRVKWCDMLSNMSGSPTRRQIIKYSKGFLFLDSEDWDPPGEYP